MIHRGSRAGLTDHGRALVKEKGHAWAWEKSPQNFIPRGVVESERFVGS